jgi:hypothetical protein
MPGSSIATIDDALARMDANLDRAIEQRDPRGYFTAVYRGVTQRVRDGVAAGEFEDNERMERFDVRFARYWLDAYAGWDRGDPIADSWRCSFETARRGATVMQNLVLGINAHINLDLAVAAAEVCPGAQILDLQRDFETINEVLAGLVDDMQDAIAVASPVSGLLDTVGLGIDEALVNFSLRTARDRAWVYAGRLAAAGSPTQMIVERDAAVARIGRDIADPPALLERLVELIGWHERQDVGAVVVALADAAQRRTPSPAAD